jgi:hypothetical protein
MIFQIHFFSTDLFFRIFGQFAQKLEKIVEWRHELEEKICSVENCHHENFREFFL